MLEQSPTFVFVRDLLLDQPFYPLLIVGLLLALACIGLCILGHLRGLHATLAEALEPERWEPTGPVLGPGVAVRQPPVPAKEED